MAQLKTTKFLAPALGVVTLTLPAVGLAQGIVQSGWDLLSTVPSETFFMGQNWEGVPIGPFDFGGSIGVKNVGITDTIVRRLGTATGDFGTSATVPIEIVALNLVSMAPFDPDAGGPAPVSLYYLSLNSVKPGGTVEIFFDDPSGGRFVNQFPVNWKMTIGSPGGPVLMTGTEQFQLDPAPGFWGHNKVNPGAGVPLIPGVNYDLNGHGDTSGDLHFAFNPDAQPGTPGGHGGVPSGPHIGADSPWYTDKALAAAIHGVTECPEPPSWAFLSALGLGGFAFYRRVRQT